MRWVYHTSPRRRGRMRFSCKATSRRRTACGRWTRCAGWPRENWRKWLEHAALESDRESRRLRLARIAEAQAKTLSPETNAIFAAYARGVNYYLETHRSRLPLEFTLLNYSPTPLAHRGYPAGGLADVSHAHHYLARTRSASCTCSKKATAQKVDFLFPARTGAEVAARFECLGDFGRAHRQRQAHSRERPASGLVRFPRPGTWCISRRADLDVTGVSLPGVPAVIIGHNGASRGA